MIGPPPKPHRCYDPNLSTFNYLIIYFFPNAQTDEFLEERLCVMSYPIKGKFYQMFLPGERIQGDFIGK